MLTNILEKKLGLKNVFSKYIFPSNTKTVQGRKDSNLLARSLFQKKGKMQDTFLRSNFTDVVSNIALCGFT